MLKDTTNCTLTSQTKNELERTNSLWLPTIVVAAIFFMVGCNDQPGNTGLDVLPDSDIIGLTFNDTSAIEMHTVWTETFNTYQAGRQIFGNYIDPEFGNISAATFTEIFPRSGLNFGIKDDLKLDSIVLRMNLESYYGRLETPQVLLIHELTESFPETDTMYSNQTLAYDDTWNIAQDRILDFTATGGVDIITVKLDPRLGERILFASPDTLGDRDLFNQLIKGFYIGTKPVTYLSREPGAIFTLFAASASTQLELYYQKRDTVEDEFVGNMEPFLISLSTPKFHNFTRTGAEEKVLSQYFQTPDENTFYEFVQGGQITNFVKFPNIDKMDEVLISKADLILHVEGKFLGSQQRFEPPFELQSIFADENGDELFIDGNRVLISQGAQYDIERGAYVVSLTNYVQELVSKRRENYGFFLGANNRAFQINRAVFGGTGHPTLKPVLQLTYTNIPK